MKILQWYNVCQNILIQWYNKHAKLSFRLKYIIEFGE